MNWNWRMFLWIVFGIQLIIYLAWAFVVLSFTEPLIVTFSSATGRGFYLGILFVLSINGAAYCSEFPEDKK